jgi:lambda family phage portal protein
MPKRPLAARIGAAWRTLWPDAASAPRGTSRMKAEVFGGAQVGRLTRDWITATLMSPDAEIRFDARVLRARARQLVRDNSTAAGFVNELANQVIGPKGILLQARATTATGKPVKATNDEIERGWKEWGHPETCAANRRVSWLDLQRQLVRSLATDGEILIRKLRYFENAHGFAVQQLDPDLLDDSFNRPAKDGQNEIRMGVEIDAWGGAVAYWLWTRHPSDITTGRKLDRVRIDASEIVHAFIEYRPGQTRGVSWFAPVLFDLKMLAGIQEAELVATRMSAAKMGFLVQKNPEAWGGQAAPSAKNEADATEMETAPGVIDELPPGWEFQGFDPTHPSTAFAPFTKAIRRDIARGVMMAYATMTGDLESVNYSSIRAGILPERDWFRTVQDFRRARLPAGLRGLDADGDPHAAGPR